jgi:hypothetical protein
MRKVTFVQEQQGLSSRKFFFQVALRGQSLKRPISRDQFFGVETLSYVPGGSQWFSQVLNGSQWFSVVLSGSHRFSMWQRVHYRCQGTSNTFG